MSKHTPGPWYVSAADDYEIHSEATPDKFPHRCKEDDLGRFVAVIGNRASDFGKANARLIAAAPEMLEALKVLLDEYLSLVASGDCGFWDAEKSGFVIAAREVIAEAEGQQ
jgi:hypothetical protein